MAAWRIYAMIRWLIAYYLPWLRRRVKSLTIYYHHFFNFIRCLTTVTPGAVRPSLKAVILQCSLFPYRHSMYGGMAPDGKRWYGASLENACSLMIWGLWERLCLGDCSRPLQCVLGTRNQSAMYVSMVCQLCRSPITRKRNWLLWISSTFGLTYVCLLPWSGDPYWQRSHG